MGKIDLLEKIKMIPDSYYQEVEDFIDFILEKKVSVSGKRHGRKLGLLKGKMIMSADFDAPLDDFKEYM
jgi:hypothetical protein